MKPKQFGDIFLYKTCEACKQRRHIDDFESWENPNVCRKCYGSETWNWYITKERPEPEYMFGIKLSFNQKIWLCLIVFLIFYAIATYIWIRMGF